MIFRKATLSDLDAMMNIIAQAQLFMKNQGLAQWQNGYPQKEIIEQDILHSNAFVLCENENILCMATVIFTGEPTYREIYDGCWLSNQEYAVVHRLAVNHEHRRGGTGSLMMRHIETFALNRSVLSIKVDTHEDNIPMQDLLRKCGYIYCGFIYLLNGDKRLAFEKLLGT